MKTLRYTPTTEGQAPNVEVPLSKSVANRWQIIKALFPDKILKNKLSEARDTRILREALASKQEDINLQDAGTAMRFATAYFSVLKGRNVYLHGTDRMHKRPIEPLVSALRSLGAEVRYDGELGYPPLRIYGKKLRGGEVRIPADMSSQFISALMLIAPATNDGLLIHRTSKSVSQPYVNMTADVLRQAGITVEEDGMRIHVHGKPKTEVQMPTEGDWSAAATFVAWTAISGSPLRVIGLVRESIQGDKILQDWLPQLGIEAKWDGDVWCIERLEIPEEDLVLDMLDYPDLAPSIVMAAFGQGRAGKVTGLQTLRIKETDRISALVRTIERMGGDTTDLSSSLYWAPAEKLDFSGEPFDTFDDHRMAMAIAPMAFFGELKLNDASVVEKSFPGYWKQMEKAGLKLE